mgnify:CR=1 FL=1
MVSARSFGQGKPVYRNINLAKIYNADGFINQVLRVYDLAVK